ncbi:BTAD domain-containing putative transcriptional regulator [Micromonospora sp. CPCC 205556]|uniref:BTAD domain-containing putative transcriptional regulator n=1 Tax=Micromonospora sp. CPCC 205556 TaxID=3122398 RepID=UPI002FF1C167
MSSKTGGAAATTATAFVSAGYATLLHTEVWQRPRVPSASQARAWLAQPLTEGFIIFLAQVGAAALAVYLMTAMFARLVARLTRATRWLPALRLPGPLQGLAAALLGATAITATVGASPATAATDAAAEGDGQPTRPRAPHDSHDAPQEPSPVAEGVPDSPTYTVRRGDTLSSIAARQLGDDSRWSDIYALNRGTHFPRVGGTLHDPDLIRPGWILDLPADTTESTPPTQRATPAPPTRQPDTRPQPAPTTAPAPSPAPTSTADDPAATTAPSTPTASTDTCTVGSSPDTKPTHDHGAERTPRGITLPTGSWIDVGLALAVAAAVALVWAHRGHRHTPRPLGAPSTDTTSISPMPRVVDQIRRGLRRAPSTHHGDQPIEPVTDAPRGERLNASHPTSECGHAPASEAPDTNGTTPAATGLTGPQMDSGSDRTSGQPTPLAPALHNPLSALWPPAGLGLTGPGAAAAARGFLIAALASGGPHQPHAQTTVVVPAPTAVRLLGVAATDLPHTPRLLTPSTLEQALDLVETQTLHRTRLVDQHDVNTVADLHDSHPDEQPPPPLMLLADATPDNERLRVAALLNQGEHLNIHGVLLGPWPHGNTIVVTEDGTTTPADGEGARHGTHPADIGRLAVLNAAEAVDLLATLAESHTRQPQPHRPTTQTPPPRTGSQAGFTCRQAPDSPAWPPDPTDQATPAPTVESSDHAVEDEVLDGDTGRAGVVEGAAAPTDAVNDTPRFSTEVTATSGKGMPPPEDFPDVAAQGKDADGEPARELSGRVRLTVLGAPRIVDGDPQRNMRAKSLELLVYLAVHNGAASAEAILDDLLPDAPTSKAAGRLYTYVSGLRAALRHNGGPGSYVTHPDHRYLLNPDMLDIDLWRMRAAIREAGQAIDPQARAAALRRAVEAYHGPLAQGCDYEWVESYREAIRQEALDAHLALADTLDGQPAQQAAVLEAAIAHQPHHEALYQAAMRARAELGHLDAIRTLRRRLTRALADIDARPGADTLALADHLVAQATHPKPGPKPAPHMAGETPA